jgi:hypothetical protein
VLVAKNVRKRSSGRSGPTLEGLLLEATEDFPYADCQLEEEVHGGF